MILILSSVLSVTISCFEAETKQRVFMLLQ